MEEVKIYSIKDGLIKADMLNQQGQYDVALEIYDMLIEKQEDCIPAYNNKAFIYEKMGEYEKALECYEKLLEYRPNVLIPLNNMAHLYIKMEDYENAEETFRKVVEIPYMNESYIYANFAHVLSQNGKYEEAIENLYLALEIDETSTIYNNLAYNYELLDDFDKALECYDKGLEINDCDASIYNNKGWVLNKMGKYDESIECYAKAIELMPTESRYYKNMAIVYKDLGDLDKAHEFYDKAFELDSTIESFEDIEN